MGGRLKRAGTGGEPERINNRRRAGQGGIVPPFFIGVAAFFQGGNVFLWHHFLGDFNMTEKGGLR